MMIFKPAALFFLLLTQSLVGQQAIVTTATDYITHNQFVPANLYLDSILKQNPKAVDALMMKGNVLLNQAWNNASKSHFNTEKAESIFDTSAIDASYFIPIIPVDTSVKIDKLWNACIQIDPSRTDIKKGLCSLYSLSLRTIDLERLLVQMEPIITQSEDNAYLFAEYARNLKNRGRFEDGMRVYALIAGMFPNLAGIRCDMANEYFYAGHFYKALQYLDSTLARKEIDQTSYINAAALYSVLGHYDKAYKTFKQYSDKDTLLEADFYKGLVMFANQDTGFSNQMHRFLDQANEQSYYDEIQIARKLLPFGHMAFTIPDLMALANDVKIARYYKVLILQRGINQFKGDCEPKLLMGTFYCAIKKYTEAIDLLKYNDNCTLDIAKDEQRKLGWIYAVFKQGLAGNYTEALLNAHDQFAQQAVQYFQAKMDWDAGKKEEAKKLFSEVAHAKQPTKYSWLSKAYAWR